MPRPVVAIASLATFGALGGLVYLHASRISSDLPDATALRPSVPTTVEWVTSPSGAMSAAGEGNSTAGPPPSEATRLFTSDSATPNGVASDNVTQWIADIRSNDAKTRAAAIAALAGAPKEHAVPALEYVVESGDPQVDQQIALNSLHTLAMNDGDSDGAIRNVIRKAMYHSDDEGVTQNAQALLEDIEAELAERARDAAKSPTGDDAAKSPTGELAR